MATPNYFSKFPNLKYAISVNRSGQGTFINIKDYFKLSTITPEQYPKDVIYYEYTIKNGMRPEQISYEQYGDEKFYYIILQVNDITDYYNQWPLSTYELERYIDKKYGSIQKGNTVRHYETKETINGDGLIVLEGGMVVGEDFEFQYRDSKDYNVLLKSKPVPVTFRDYEYRINEQKTKIQLLNKDLIFKYESEMLDYVETFRGQNIKSDISISDFTH